MALKYKPNIKVQESLFNQPEFLKNLYHGLDVHLFTSDESDDFDTSEAVNKLNLLELEPSDLVRRAKENRTAIIIQQYYQFNKEIAKQWIYYPNGDKLARETGFDIFSKHDLINATLDNIDIQAVLITIDMKNLQQNLLNIFVEKLGEIK